MVTVMLALVGCGSSDPPRSVPIPPTVAFPAENVSGDREIVWTDLEEVFPTRAATLPPPLAELRPGMDGTRARAVLEAAHAPGARVFTDSADGTVAVGSLLVDTTNVGVTLLLGDGGKTLSAVDVSVPDEVAVPMLTTRWGPPTGTEYQDGGAPRYQWVVAGEPWTAELYSKPGDKAIVKFSPNVAAD